MARYFPLKLSVTEGGLTDETGLKIEKHYCGMGTSFTLHLLSKSEQNSLVNPGTLRVPKLSPRGEQSEKPFLGMNSYVFLNRIENSSVFRAGNESATC